MSVERFFCLEFSLLLSFVQAKESKSARAGITYEYLAVALQEIKTRII
jgi:hypothetical protein